MSTTYTPAVPAEFVGLAQQFLRDTAREHAVGAGYAGAHHRAGVHPIGAAPWA